MTKLIKVAIPEECPYRTQMIGYNSLTGEQHCKCKLLWAFSGYHFNDVSCYCQNNDFMHNCPLEEMTC